MPKRKVSTDGEQQCSLMPSQQQIRQVGHRISVGKRGLRSIDAYASGDARRKEDKLLHGISDACSLFDRHLRSEKGVPQ